MDENTKTSTGGFSTTPEPGKPLETGPGENGARKRLHATGQQGAMAVVGLSTTTRLQTLRGLAGQAKGGSNWPLG